MKTLKLLLKLRKFYLLLDEITDKNITEQDKQNLSSLYVDPRYKSLEKVINVIILNLENKVFKESKLLEDFIAIQWTRLSLQLFLSKVREEYNSIIRKSHAKSRRENAPNHEAFEEIPDGVPISQV